jgi:Family of unknown function (DUF6492)
MAVTVDVVVRSYYRDLQWLRYCLRSIDRFCSEFRRTVVVVPESCRERIQRSPLEQVEMVFCPNYPDDYLGQQVTKLYADTMTDADFILHIDSDCTFHRPVKPADFFSDGRPELMITPVEAFHVGPPWQRQTERAVGFPVKYDYMRRHPHVYPRWLYEELRAHIRSVHGRELADYVLDQGPLGFSEFNALGALAHRDHPDAFSWGEWLLPDYDERFCRIHWSWGGLTAEIRNELEAILTKADTIEAA